ncbi:MAG: elongation factor G [Clostridiaceae bacterium BRH_c20a]|nr:MAG: elongation factor G [Clostridiaceae bacterium BRH_c20a]
MKTYTPDKIRNVGIVAHGGAGKTSLTEAILYNAGLTSRLGKVDDGTTVTDYLPEEIKRKVTITSTLAPLEWNNTKINFVDTPGYADFIGEVKGALRAVDNVLMVVCGVSGVEVQTEVIWDFANEKNMPRILFVNKLDRENSSFFKVIDELKDSFGAGIAPIQLPIGSESGFSGVVDILQLKAYTFKDGKISEIAIPDDLQAQAQEYRDALMESVAEGDDELLMKYLEGEVLSPEEIIKGFKKGVREGKIYPVLAGSALSNIGIPNLVDAIVDFLPTPSDLSETDLLAQAPAALVYKTLADPYVGKLSFFRLYSGKLKTTDNIYNANKEKEEKVSSFLMVRGKTQENLSEIMAGDIAAVAKLQETMTGHTLCLKSKPQLLESIDFPEPALAVAISPKSRGDEDKVGNAISRLLEEDPTLKVEKNSETKETILKGMGDLHLDIITERMKAKFGVEVEMRTPKVPYRETIRGNIKIQGKHKKQSGGAGQYGDVWLTLEPLPDGDFEFHESVFGGAVPRNYFPAVEKGVREAMQEGMLAGYPVANLKVTLVDGSYHPVDSNEMSFKIAGSLAFRKGMEKANPVLLEPIMNVEIVIPEQFMGDIMGDINSKRGRIMGMESKGKFQVIKAQAPLSEMSRYAIDLKSITQARGSFKMELSHYEDVPHKIAEEIINSRKKEEEK